MSYKLQHAAKEIDDKLSLINKNKNLLPYPYEESSCGGLIDVGDGSVLTTKDSPETSESFLLNTVTLPGGKKYTISLVITNFIDEFDMVDSTGFKLIVSGSGEPISVSSSTTLDLSLKSEKEETAISVVLEVPAGFKDNLLIKPQIEEGELQTSWVPYMKNIANYVDERFNSTNAKIKVLAEAAGPENIEDGTTTGIHQIADGVANGFSFKDKNSVLKTIEEADLNTNLKDANKQFFKNLKEWDSGTSKVPYGATGAFANAFGGKSAAIGKRASALGTTTIAGGAYSFATGNNTITIGDMAFAANDQAVAEGPASAAFGSETHARGNGSASFGKQTKAIGDYSFAVGYQSEANSQSSAAIGVGAVTSSEINGQVVVGRYNATASPNSVFIVGSGGNADTRETAMSIDIYGNMWKGSKPSELDRYITAGEAFRIPESVIDKADGTYIPCYAVGDGSITSGKASPNSLQLATSWAKENSLVGRDENGAINTGEPTKATHAATKYYVDTLIKSALNSTY